jgi:hypothetical protein
VFVRLRLTSCFLEVFRKDQVSRISSVLLIFVGPIF